MIGAVLTLGLGSFGSVNKLPTLGYGAGAPAPPAVSTIPQGGAGHPTVYWGVRKHKKWKRNLDWLLDRVVSDYYGELTQPTVPFQVRKEAKQIVKPYVEKKQVNWSKFEGDLDRVIKLLELYQHLQDIEDDDETWLMMH